MAMQMSTTAEATAESQSSIPVASLLPWRSADAAADVVAAFTPEGSGRPEPLRVARLAARAGREQWVDGSEKTED